MSEFQARFKRIADDEGSDKSWGHGYESAYEEILGGTCPRRILEIGVHTGASLRLWEQLFPEAAVIGIDIDPKCADVPRARASVEIGDAADAAFVTGVADRYGPFDLVVDDGSHHPGDILAAFAALWPRAGRYVIEDVWHEHLAGLLTAVRGAGGCSRTFASSSPNRYLITAVKELPC